MKISVSICFFFKLKNVKILIFRRNEHEFFIVFLINLEEPFKRSGIVLLIEFFSSFAAFLLGVNKEKIQLSASKWRIVFAIPEDRLCYACVMLIEANRINIQ